VDAPASADDERRTRHGDPATVPSLWPRDARGDGRLDVSGLWALGTMIPLPLILAALLIGVAGCATLTSTADAEHAARIRFALRYGAIATRLSEACQTERIPPSLCTDLAVADRAIRRELAKPAPSAWSEIADAIGSVLGAAVGGALK
jgi:hypothetical protein